MNSDEITGRQQRAWVTAAMAAPLARAAAGYTWPAVLTVGGITLFLSWWLAKYTAELKPWLVILQGLWASVIVSELLWWIGDCWPGHNSAKAAPLILLALAAWPASGGEGRAARVGCTLVWPVGFLLGAVLLSALPEVKAENLLPFWGMRDASLIPVLLLPVLYGKGKKGSGGKTWIGLLALAVLAAVAAAGVLSPGVCGRAGFAFYELSRSIQILGIAERFESVAAAGMTLGYFASASYLLSVPEGMENKGRMVWAYAGLAGILYVMDLRIDSRVLAIGSILLWVLFPAVSSFKIIFQKTSKTS